MRYVNRLLSVVVALALIALAVVVPVEIARAALGRPPWLVPFESWRSTLLATTWQDGWVRAVLVGLVLLGLLLLLVQLKPRRPGTLGLQPLTENVSAGTTRRSLQQSLSHAATEVDGVARASAKAGRRRVSVTAVPRLRDASGLEEQVRRSVTTRLEGLQLAQAPKLTVRVRGGGR